MLAHHLFEMRHRVARLALFGDHLGATEVELDAVRRLLVHDVLGTVLHIRDALGVERMRAQVGGRVVLVEPRRLLHPPEERSHGADVEAGLLEILEADAVGLALEVARVVELRLRARRRCPGDDRLGDVRARTRGEQPQQHRRHRGN
jgi:hypothetical protein